MSTLTVSGPEAGERFVAPSPASEICFSVASVSIAWVVIVSKRLFVDGDCGEAVFSSWSGVLPDSRPVVLNGSDPELK